MINKSKEQGFTLIELLLVVVIIGILLAVIVPRAWRANVDSKYGLVRQNCTELASFASQWAEQQIEAQDLASDSKLIAYYGSLTFTSTSTAGNTFSETGGQWIARNTTSNWNNDADTRQGVTGREIGEDTALPEAAVEDLVPPERLPRNPFSGSSVFRDLPTESIVIPGAIAAGRAVDQDYGYFALVFQGTDSTPAELDNTANSAVFHAGMGTDLPGLRNGIFMARIMREE